MGNPHAVAAGVRCENRAASRGLGPSIEHHPRFPKRTNVGFMQIVDRGHLRLRGLSSAELDETLACARGPAAAVAVGSQQGLLDAGGTSRNLRRSPQWFPGPRRASICGSLGRQTTVFTGSIVFNVM